MGFKARKAKLDHEGRDKFGVFHNIPMPPYIVYEVEHDGTTYRHVEATDRLDAIAQVKTAICLQKIINRNRQK